MAQEPYIKLPRKLFRDLAAGGSREWNERRRFNRFEALIYLYAKASYEDGRTWVLSTGAEITLARGETPPLSLSYLAEAWGWARNTVDKFIHQEKQKLARGRNTPKDGGTLLVLFYDQWDAAWDEGQDASGDAGRDGQTRRRQRVTRGARDAPGDGGRDAEGDGERDEKKSEGRSGTQGNAKSPSSSPASGVVAVYEHWKRASQREHDLTDARRKKIEARLAKWTVEQLCLVADSAHRNPFYLGENDRGTYYGRMETIYKSDEAVQGHLDWHRENPPSRAGRGVDIDDLPLI